jgi:hypothetical protein
MNEQEQTGQTRQAPRESIIATRATMHEAKRHFEAGGAVLVSEYGHEPTQTVTPITTTHDRTSTTWDALAADVKEWRNRYPNQRFYIVPAVDACTCTTDEDDIGQEQEQEQEQAAPTMADAATYPTTTTDPMADQTTWTTYGVSDAEHAAIAATGRHLIGRSPLGATATGPEIVIDEVMAWRGTALTVTQVADLYEALTVGFSVEQDTGLAIDAVLDEIGWLPDLRGSIDGEVVVKLPANPARTSVLELLHRIADSEGGRFYIDKEGKVVQESRSADVSEFPLPAYTFTDNNRDTNPTDVGLADGALKITIDDKLTYDAAEITREGGVTQRAALNSTPLRTFSRTGLLFLTDSQSLGLASWYPFRYGTPQARTESWTVNPEVYPDDWGTILSLEIGNRVSIELTPG